MSKGIKIKIRRQIGARKRRQDDCYIRIWTGTHLCNVDSVPHSEHWADMYGQYPETVITPIQFPPPGALPPAARAYPRILPFKQRANDDYVKTGRRGRLNSLKIRLLDTEGTTPPIGPSDQIARYLTPDALEETLLRRLSKQYRRHVFIHANGRYGYIDDTLRFVAVD